MKITKHPYKTSSCLMNWGKIMLMITAIILLGFTSCRARHASKYGGPPADYKQMDKTQ